MDYKKGIVFTTYFDKVENLVKKSNDISNEINSFYNNNLLKKQSIKLESILSFLWRKSISNYSFLLTKFTDLFTINSKFEFKNINNFNSQFEQHLLKKKISFKRLNPNLLFINQSLLFITITKFDSKALLKLLKKFHSKYYIFLLILNKRVYEQVLKIDKINLLSNIKVIDSGKFLKLDFEIFRKHKLLENSQINSNVLS